MPSKSLAREFLKQRRIAVVGLSRNKDDFSRLVYQRMQEKGYQLYAVNPNAESTESLRYYRSLRDLPEPVDGALVLVPAAISESVVQDCQAMGIRRVWLHRTAGPGAVSPEAVALARSAGISVVEGGCAFMFLGPWLHKLHTMFARFDP